MLLFRFPVVRYMGIGTPAGHRSKDHGGAWDIRMDLDCLCSLGIRFCVPLECIEFWECFFISWLERYISWLVLS